MANVPKISVCVKSPRTPCYGCQDRNANCHSACVKYGEWKAESEAVKAEVRKKIVAEREIIDYEIKRKRKTRQI